MLDIQPFTDLEADLLADDYRRGTPSPACEIDRQIAERDTCPTCGAHLSFAPFIRWSHSLQRHVYRAFAVCRMCDAATEF